MLIRQLALCTLLLVALPSPVLAALIDVTYTDPTSDYTGGIFNTFDIPGAADAGGPAANNPPLNPILVGSTLHLELALSGAAQPYVFGTKFVGATGGGDDLIILDSGGGTILTATVNQIFVTNVITKPNYDINEITLGGFAGPSQSLITINSDPFGLADSPTGGLHLLLNELSPGFNLLTDLVFDTDLTTQSNITLQLLTPEPGSGLLLGSSLVALAAWRRRTRRAH